MNSELHLMIDLETLSTRPNAAILEVGYAIFETAAETIQQSGSWKLDLQDQLWPEQAPRHVEGSTLAWWSEQSDDVRANVFRGMPRVPVPDFLRQFREWIDWHNIQGVWSHGLGFDVPIMEDLHKQWNRVTPWYYRTPRDTRTLFWLAGMSSADMVPATLKHSAEADAIAQALTVQIALKKLLRQSYAAS